MMRNRITGVLVLLSASLALVVAAEKDDASAKDLEKFQGTWVFERHEIDGKESPKPAAPMTITFKGDAWAVKVGDKVVQAGTHKFDANMKPKTVDAKVTEGEGKGTTMLGIYEIDGDTIKACFDPAGKKRPTEFKSTAGSGSFLAIVKREKK